MPQIVSLLVAVLISIVAGPLWAAPNERDALVREVMRLSGLEQQVRAIPQQVLSGFEKDGKKLPPAQYQRLRRSLARTWVSVLVSKRADGDFGRAWLAGSRVRMRMPALTRSWMRRTAVLEETCSAAMLSAETDRR